MEMVSAEKAKKAKKKPQNNYYTSRIRRVRERERAVAK